MLYKESTDKAFTDKNLVPMKEAIRLGYGSRTKLTKWVKAGKLPAVRNGRYVFFKQEDLDAMFQPAMPTEAQRLKTLQQQIADAAPSLSAEAKRELADLLTA